MSILKYSDLRSYTSTNHMIRLQKSLSANIYKPKIFLSHRHADKDWVAPIAAYLTELGNDIYVDWLDRDAPEETSAATAILLQNRIRQAKKVIVIASPGSLDSKWIPWELGFADSTKGKDHIAILPVGNSDSDWVSREYFRIYSDIKKVQNNNMGVFKPNTDTGVYLTHWCNG